MSYNVLRYIMKHQSSHQRAFRPYHTNRRSSSIVLKKKNPSSFFRRLSCTCCPPVRRGFLSSRSARSSSVESAPACTDEHTRARWLSCFAAHAPPASQVLASDASPWGFAVCCAEVPEPIVVEALRFAEMRGEFVSLEGKAARRPAQGCRVAEQRPLAAGWEDVPWRTCFARPWRSGRLEQALGELPL